MGHSAFLGMTELPHQPVPAPHDDTPPVAFLLPLGLGLLLFAWPTLSGLVGIYRTHDNFSHGFLIPVIAVYAAWRLRRDLVPASGPTRLLGVVPLALGLGIVLFSRWYELALLPRGVIALFMAGFGLVFVLTGLAWVAVGWQGVRRLTFPLGFLLLGLPIPSFLLHRATIPLQQVAAAISAAALHLIGVTVERQGSVLRFPVGDLGVDEACSGIRSLAVLTAVALAMIHFNRPSRRGAIVLLLAVVPLAVLTNAVRVFLSGVFLTLGWKQLTHGGPHELLGLFTFALAVGGMAALSSLLSQRAEHASRPGVPLPDPVIRASRPVPLPDSASRPVPLPDSASRPGLPLPDHPTPGVGSSPPLAAAAGCPRGRVMAPPAYPSDLPSATGVGSGVPDLPPALAPRAPLPCIPCLPSVPSVPRVPSVPSVPSVPRVPPVPCVPSVPSVPWPTSLSSLANAAFGAALLLFCGAALSFILNTHYDRLYARDLARLAGRRPLAEFPSQVGPYVRVSSHDLSEGEFRMLDPSEQSIATYLGPDGRQFTVTILYWDPPEGRPSRRPDLLKRPHSPDWCFPAAGWKRLRSLDGTCPPDVFPGEQGRVRVFERNQQTMVVLFWTGVTAARNDAPDQIFQRLSDMAHSWSNPPLANLHTVTVCTLVDRRDPAAARAAATVLARELASILPDYGVGLRR